MIVWSSVVNLCFCYCKICGEDVEELSRLGLSTFFVYVCGIELFDWFNVFVCVEFMLKMMLTLC